MSGEGQPDQGVQAEPEEALDVAAKLRLPSKGWKEKAGRQRLVALDVAAKLRLRECASTRRPRAR